MMPRSTEGSSFTFLACTLRIASRPRTSGRFTVIWRSKRPGRSNAGSNTSGRFVAAMMMMPSWVSKPSISTSSALSVCSRSSLPPPNPCPRLRPTASISSMKIRQGVFLRACSNMSRTRLAPTPTNISTKSDPLMLKNAASASPAIALASSVLPVPGEPTISTPLGIRPPSFWNFLGSFKNSTSSETSSLASSTPATSLKVVLFFSLASIRALLLPKLRAPLPAILIWRTKTNQMMPPTIRKGSRPHTTLVTMGFGSLAEKFSRASSSLHSFLVSSTLVLKWPLVSGGSLVFSAAFSAASCGRLKVPVISVMKVACGLNATVPLAIQLEARFCLNSCWLQVSYPFSLMLRINITKTTQQMIRIQTNQLRAGILKSPFFRWRSSSRFRLSSDITFTSFAGNHALRAGTLRLNITGSSANATAVLLMAPAGTPGPVAPPPPKKSPRSASPPPPSRAGAPAAPSGW